MRQNIRTLRNWRLLSVLSITTLAVLLLGWLSSAQVRDQELFKVRYGDQPQLLQMVLLRARDNGEEGEENPPYGGVSNFCVSWDGRLFYFADLMRGDLKLDDEEDSSVSKTEKRQVPWVQVYDRSGRWVRTVEIPKGYPSYFRVDSQGRLYVCADDGVEVYEPDGRHNKTLSERLQSAVRAARAQYNLENSVAFLEVDAQGHVYFWVSLKREMVPEGESNMEQLLALTPTGGTRLIPIESFSPNGIDRYRGEIITANYQRPFTEGFIRKHETILYDQEEQEVIDSATCSLHTSLPYKVVDSSGEVARTFSWQVDISHHASNLFDAYTMAFCGCLPHSVMTDAQGHLYRLYLRPRVERETLSTNSGLEWLRVDRGFAIVEFDSQGRFLRVRARDLALETDFSTARLWDVDREGNVYWVEFQPDHLRVMMAPRQ
ncbi:MAG: hypothetical protein N2651_09305 [Fimbriimonadales bacterium]|nr:hypothetical protein [Fimbriimonadales bacterium]